MRKLLTVLASIAVILPSIAGGLNENANRSVAYLRLGARGTSFDPDAIYFNPAGTAFMEDGWHFDVNWQQAIQKRTIQSTFAPFAQNVSYLGQSSREYIGNTYAPVIPSFHVVWKKKKWAVMGAFEISGGGGNLDFDNGLASFESEGSVLPTAMTSLGLTTTQYGMKSSLNAYSLKGTVTLGGAYQILPCLAVAVEANLNTSLATYKASVTDIEVNPVHPVLNPTGAMVNAYTLFTKMGYTDYANLVADKHLDVSQSGFSINPVIAVCFHKNGWTANVKYAFKADMTLTNKTKEDIGGQYPDGGKVKDDVAAGLEIAGGYNFGKARVALQWNHYFEKGAQNSFSSCVTGATNEFAASFEYDITKRVLLSCGAVRCDYQQDINKMTDQNFDLSNTSLCIGGAVKVCKICKIDVGVMYTFYDKVERTQTVYYDNMLGLPGSDVFKRNSLVFGVGATFKFLKK